MTTSSSSTGDLVATWDIPHSAHTHRVEFEHGTTTGRRVIRVDGQVTKKNKNKSNFNT